MKARKLTVAAVAWSMLAACGGDPQDNNVNGTANNTTNTNNSASNNTTPNNVVDNSSTNNVVDNNVATNNTTPTNNMTIGRAGGAGLGATGDFANSASAWHRANLDGAATADDNSFGSGDVNVALGASWAYVLDRNNSQVQVLDPSANLGDLGVIDVSGVGATNPQDATDAGGNAYISLYNTGEIAVATPNGADWDQSRLDLAQYDTFDSNPEPSAIATDSAFVLVVLQRLQNFVGIESSLMLVIDSSDNAISDPPLDLGATNAQAGLRAFGGNFAVGVTGDFGVNDGGILQIVRNGAGDYSVGEMLITEDDLGGDLLDFVLVSDASGFAVITLPDFSSELLSFTFGANVEVDVVSGVTAPGFGGLDHKEGWLVVGDRDPASAGFWFFDLADPFVDTAQPLLTTLPPSGFVFLP